MLDTGKRHPSDVLIGLYAAGYKFLPAESAQAVATHLRSCNRCAKRFVTRCLNVDDESNGESAIGESAQQNSQLEE